MSTSIAILVIFVFLISLGCLYGLAAPQRFSDKFLQIWQRKFTLHIAVLARLVFGVSLLLASNASAFPITFKVLGFIIIVSAFIILISPKEKVSKIIHWFIDLKPIFIRSWLILGLIFAAFIAYALPH